MVSAALKYLIGELCINVFFDQVFTSFNIDQGTKKPIIGMYYSKICHKYSIETFYDCVVVDVVPLINGEKLIYVKFKSSDYDESLADDDGDYDNGDGDEYDDPTENMTEEEIEAYFDALDNNESDDGDVATDEDLCEIDLIETDEDDVVGINTKFYTLHI